MNYLEFIARVTSHIPDKGQVMIRYYGLYANAHRGKMSKVGVLPSHPPIIEEEERFVAIPKTKFLWWQPIYSDIAIETVILRICRVKAGPSGNASLDTIYRVTRKTHSIDTRKSLVDG